ncbi:MAG: cell division protein FtsA [Campylobacteraceae bacterium]|nr:cell division protein FtsA [Campylobacteraceae bacterium]
MNNYYILGLDIGSVNISAAIAKFSPDSDNLSISGIGRARTNGLKKGVVTNIEKASTSIRQAAKEAMKTAGCKPDRVVVSIAGAYTGSVKSQGIVSVPSGEISINEIKRAMQMAQDNAIIDKDQVILHVLPYEFKVDGQDHIEDPIGMSGSRLEVFTHVITAEGNSIRNLIKATNMAGLKIDNMVLAGYASALATLTKDEKELGVGLIDLGGATCDIVVHLGNSIVYNDTLPVGSTNITMDLSRALNTPLANAEEIKINYTKLLESGVSELQLPTMGEVSLTHEASMDIVTKVIYARIEETILLLLNKFENSGYLNKLGSGLVLTGGMSKLDDIRNLTSLMFDNIPVRIAKPRSVDGLFEVSEDAKNSCVVGLCLYGSGEFTRYEIDSNGELKYKDSHLKSMTSTKSVNSAPVIEKEKVEYKEDKSEDLIKISKISEKNAEDMHTFTKILNRLKQLF